MEEQKVVLDTRPGQQRAYLGADVRIVPGPKTFTIEVHKAVSGHLMVPISCFNKQPGRQPPQEHDKKLHLLQTTVGVQGDARGDPQV